ncbi:C2 family cysteine protease [Streptomyces alanosinicus]|uniref:Calpain catalytic domain-containing protein n=1 Tax=Streptomyces alanosinicus TaxID=68171 RepID=A0A918YQW5_9ACTN|nr:C2 family cysteine protease [Streptomyces alanosinicus]GHE11732.1 hypothetical protein GCM10010339_72530 [Streptomyces alanosinicus]
MGDGYVGFDIPGVRKLASDLDGLAAHASPLHRSLKAVLEMAQTNLSAGKVASNDPDLQALATPLGDFSLFGGTFHLPGVLTGELGDMQADIKRRLAQLEGMRKLADLGYPVDPSMTFADEKPPDPQKIQDALKFFREHLDKEVVDRGFYVSPDSDPILKEFKTLTPAELDAVVSKLSDDDLQRLDQQVKVSFGNGDQLRRDWANLMFSSVSATNVARVAKDMPCLEPTIDGDYGYGDVNGNLFGPNGVDVKHDLAQGNEGDCWFLASLGAVGQQDPQFFQNHIRQNPNGTYTVTFYRDGKPVDVTVDGKLPVRSDGGTAYAEVRDNVKWVAIYEKAFAQFKGGYKSIDGGWGDEGLDAVTGQSTERLDSDDLSLTDLKSKLDQGYAITTGSKDNKTLWFFGGSDSTDNHQIVTTHEYVVQHVDTDAHPPTVTLLNPWGDNGLDDAQVKIPQQITLTEDQWHKYFDEVGTTKGKV